MSVKKDIIITEAISWPRGCAKCGTPRNLKLVSTSIRRTDSVNPFLVLFGIIYSKGRRFRLSYPVCGSHVIGTQIAAALSGRVGILIYLFAGAVLCGCVDELTGGAPAPLRLNDKLHLAGYAFLAIAALVVTFLSRRWIPVRLSHWETPADNWGGDIVRLTFSSEVYAREFTRANLATHNTKKIKRRPWYHINYWPQLFFYALLAMLVLVLLITKIH